MKTFLSNPIKRKQIFLLLVDSIIIICAFVCSYFVRITILEGGYTSDLFSRFSWLVLMAVLLHVGTLYVFELYNLEVKRSDNKVLLLITVAVFTATGMLALLSYLDPQNKLGRVVLAVHLPITVVLLFFWRKLFFSLSLQTLPPNNLLMIGSSSLDDEIMEYLKGKSECILSKKVLLFLRALKSFRFSQNKKIFVPAYWVMNNPYMMLLHCKYGDDFLSQILDFLIPQVRQEDKLSFYEMNQDICFFKCYSKNPFY